MTATPDEPSVNTQNAEILAHLRSGSGITPITALEFYGCFRLSARIYDLKQLGHAIERETVRTASGKRVARYRMGAQ